MDRAKLGIFSNGFHCSVNYDLMDSNCYFYYLGKLVKILKSMGSVEPVEPVLMKPLSVPLLCMSAAK